VRLVLAALLSSLAACASFTTPSAATLAHIAPAPVAARLPGRFELELATSGLTGTFDAVVAVEGSSFRVQVFPDVGGKVLDLMVGADRVVATMPGSRYEASAPLDGAEPHLALALALVFAELLAPVRGERVLGERAVGDGVEVELRPALGAGRVRAALDGNGAVARYELALGRIELTLTGDGAFAGRGASGRIGGG
jgi:hypothetical protein